MIVLQSYSGVISPPLAASQASEFLSTPRSPQYKNICKRRNYPPGVAIGEELNTKNLLPNPPTLAIGNKTLSKIPSVGISGPKVLNYGVS